MEEDKQALSQDFFKSQRTKFLLQLEKASKDEREAMVEVAAREAAAGTTAAVTDLVAAIKRYGLARPGLRQYLYKDYDVDIAESAVLIAVAYRIGSFKGTSKFSSWLYSVARNEAKQFIRGESRHSSRASQTSVEDHAEHFVAHVSSIIVDQMVVKNEMRNLSADHYQVLVLREEEGLTYDEIAEQLDIPLSTAKSRVRRARFDLAERLSKFFRPS